MDGNLNFIFDIQINSNSLSTLFLVPGQILALGQIVWLLLGHFQAGGEIAHVPPNDPCVSQHFLLVLGLEGSKEPKPSLRCLANTTNPCTDMPHLSLRPCVLYVNRVIIKHTFWICNHSFDNYWYPKETHFLCITPVIHKSFVLL